MLLFSDKISLIQKDFQKNFDTDVSNEIDPVIYTMTHEGGGGLGVNPPPHRRFKKTKNLSS